MVLSSLGQNILRRVGNWLNYGNTTINSFHVSQLSYVNAKHIILSKFYAPNKNIYKYIHARNIHFIETPLVYFIIA
jgi:hypothetical protein